MDRIEQLDKLLQGTLSDFALDLSMSWYGREREAVSLYAFGYLIPECQPQCVLRDRTQIGIEVAVPQLSPEASSRIGGSERPKPQVCKDLVLWPERGMNCWDAHGNPTRYPMAVIQWKVGGVDSLREDIAWLGEYSSDKPDLVGYAVALEVGATGLRLHCTRVHRGKVTEDWLGIGRAATAL
jgi:hypothetical protein